MPVPKRKRSRSRRDKRFANKGLEVKAIAACSACQTPLIPHSMCQRCGFYKGRKVASVKLDRNLRRAEMRETQKARTAARQQVGDASNASSVE